jgi:hypothetical protein
MVVTYRVIVPLTPAVDVFRMRLHDPAIVRMTVQGTVYRRYEKSGSWRGHKLVRCQGLIGLRKAGRSRSSGVRLTDRGVKGETFFIGFSQRGSLQRTIRRFPSTLWQNPVVRPFATGDDQDLASRSGNGYSAAHDPWC